jgi:hypothetical protein
MTVYFKSLPILNSPWVERGVASSTPPANVNVVGAGRARSRRSRKAQRSALAAAVVGSLAAAPGCTHRDPPAPDATPWMAGPEGESPSAAALSGESGAPEASAASADHLALEPPDPGALPQTRDVPSADSPAFAARAEALWNAIVKDDPEAAMAFFFPLSAYRQVKDVADPASDWKRRLVAAYARDIHALHARLGAKAARATFVGLDVPRGRARWVEPGEEWNKLGYFRVFDSKLRFDVDGSREGSEGGVFDVKSLISWRGEWYVVHLSAVR